jgi:hypothetical protein
VRNLDLARDYVTRAGIRLEALEVLYRGESWADVVRESQEIVELTLKGLLRAFGVTPPPAYDVSDFSSPNETGSPKRSSPSSRRSPRSRASSGATASSRSTERKTSPRHPSTRNATPPARAAERRKRWKWCALTCCESRGRCGGPGRSRTSDQRFRKPLLYPLSYGAAGKAGAGHNRRRRELFTAIPGRSPLAPEL